ncbi:MAG: DUF1501 domain-containing protein [Planctomycetota bacterium]
MKSITRSLDPEGRRIFVERCATSAFGLSILSPTVPAKAARPDKRRSGVASAGSAGKATSVIWLNLSGGLSHIDSLDPKRGRSKGPADPISTAVPGTQFTSYFPKLATVADRVSVIRTMYAEIGVHKPASYLMRTGYEGRGTIRHPHIGAWGSHYLGRSSETLPSSVCVNRRSDQANGFFPTSYAPLAIGSPNAGVQNTDPLGSAQKLKKRVGLLDELDAGFRSKIGDQKVAAYNGYYDDALALMKARDLDAFDLSKEKDSVREAYGKNAFGQGCLLARRLAETGVRFIEVDHKGWDHHKALPDEMAELSPVFDIAFATLIEDLEQRGMLDTTLVVVATEFGRKPEFDGDGRSHHPTCFSTIMAGGGVKTGYVHGRSDKDGRNVEEGMVTVGAFHATAGHALGMNIEEPAISASGRPFTVGNGEKPVLELFA